MNERSRMRSLEQNNWPDFCTSKMAKIRWEGFGGALWSGGCWKMDHSLFPLGWERKEACPMLQKEKPAFWLKFLSASLLHVTIFMPNEVGWAWAIHGDWLMRHYLCMHIGALIQPAFWCYLFFDVFKDESKVYLLSHFIPRKPWNDLAGHGLREPSTS